jgi:hypothetical protein
MATAVVKKQMKPSVVEQPGQPDDDNDNYDDEAVELSPPPSPPREDFPQYGTATKPTAIVQNGEKKQEALTQVKNPVYGMTPVTNENLPQPPIIHSPVPTYPLGAATYPVLETEPQHQQVVYYPPIQQQQQQQPETIPLTYENLKRLPSYQIGSATSSIISSKRGHRRRRGINREINKNRNNNNNNHHHKYKGGRHKRRTRRIGDQIEPSAPSLTSAVSTDSEFSGELSSVASTDVESEIEEEESDVIVDAQDAFDLSRRRGDVVGIYKELRMQDFLCLHCGKDPFKSTRPVVNFSCCGRKSHYVCVAGNPNTHRLIMKGMIACFQCLRPCDLPPFDDILHRYQEGALTCLKEQKAKSVYNDDDDDDDNNMESDEENPTTTQRLKHMWRSYGALQAHLKKHGILKGVGSFLKSEDRTKPPAMDWDKALEHGVNINVLLDAGWSLETIVEEFCLYAFDDKEWKEKLGLDRNNFLELSFENMWWFMNKYRPHPLELREHFKIGLKHLWQTAMRRRESTGGSTTSSRCRSPASCDEEDEAGDYKRRMGKRSNGGSELVQALNERVKAKRVNIDASKRGGSSRNYQTTDMICKQYQVLSPRQLAVLGFNLHEMISMGFKKDHFENFPYFTMDDWITHLGFRKPHWTCLGLNKSDFHSNMGVLGSKKLRGWNLDVLLLKRWRTTPSELQEMGIVSNSQFENLLSNSNIEPVVAQQQMNPIPYYVQHQQQQQQQQLPLPPSHPNYYPVHPHQYGQRPVVYAYGPPPPPPHGNIMHVPIRKRGRGGRMLPHHIHPYRGRQVFVVRKQRRDTRGRAKRTQNRRNMIQ